MSTDITPPILTSLSVPAFLDLKNGSASLSISGTASDLGSGVDKVVIYFDKNLTYDIGRGGGSYNFLGNFGIYDSWSDGISRQTYVIAATNASGVYNVMNVTVTDLQGNTATYSQSQLKAVGINTAINVMGATPDVIPPILTSLSIPAFLDLKNGAAPLSISGTASDPGSGVDKVVIYLDKNLTYDIGTGGGSYNFLGNFGIYDSWSDGISRQSYVVAPTNASGTYNVLSVKVTDLQGNTATYSQSQLKAAGINTAINVVGAASDTTPPMLTSLSIPSFLDLKNGAAPLLISGTASDAGSGVDKVVIYFDKNLTYDIGTGGGSYNFLGNFGIYDSWADGMSRQSYVVAATNLPGTYSVLSVKVTDLQGNVATYGQSQLQALGINTSVNVSDGVFVPNTLAAVVSSEQGKLVIALSAAKWSTLGNALSFQLGYDSSIVHFDSWRGGESGIYSASTNVLETGSTGVINFSGYISNTTDNTDFIKLIFTPAQQQGNFTYGFSSESFNSESLPNTSGRYAFGIGTNGNDLFSGKVGDDHFDGGSGIDTVSYSGSKTEFSIVKTSTGFSVTDKLAGNGVDNLQNVERLKFSDGSIALDMDGVGGQAYRVYQAAFNRSPDLVGLGFWMSQMDKGLSLREVAAGFVASSEYVALYGANPTNEQIVDKLYQNVLHRAGEAGGVTFWLHVLDEKLETVAGVLMSFSESTENQAALVGVIGNGFPYIPYN